MPLLSFAEENYLKAIYKLSERGGTKITTNSISEMVETSPASVSDMLRKLSEKKLINYTKYHGVSLTAGGKRTAGMVVRKHRLWELFLVEKLKYNWDEVHEIAEQLEHIQSESLVKRLYQFLGSPKYDPHGDPIPDEHGNISPTDHHVLSDAPINEKVVVTGVRDHTAEFLKFIAQMGIKTGTEVTVKEINSFDHSMSVRIGSTRKNNYITETVAKNILVTPLSK